jgi:hypothetical protein
LCFDPCTLNKTPSTKYEAQSSESLENRIVTARQFEI